MIKLIFTSFLIMFELCAAIAYIIQLDFKMSIHWIVVAILNVCLTF